MLFVTGSVGMARHRMLAVSRHRMLAVCVSQTQRCVCLKHTVLRSLAPASGVPGHCHLAAVGGLGGLLLFQLQHCWRLHQCYGVPRLFLPRAQWCDHSHAVLGLRQQQRAAMDDTRHQNRQPLGPAPQQHGLCSSAWWCQGDGMRRPRAAQQASNNGTGHRLRLPSSQPNRHR